VAIRRTDPLHPTGDGEGDGVRVGDVAPDFALPGTGGRTYRLSELRGRTVVLLFYPGDATPVCTRQLTSYTTDFDQFARLGAQLLAISPQSVESHEAFSAAQGGFAFPLLADLDRSVARAYGVLGPLGFYRRSVFVVDAEGIVRFRHRSPHSLTFRPSEALVEAVRRAERSASPPG
jgi:thioredoxin-dependent peroxiredoxin